MKACEAFRSKLSSSRPALDGRSAEDKSTVGSGAGARQPNLEESFSRLGVGAIEDYAEYLPPGGKPDSIKNLYAGTPFLTGGSKGANLMYATGAEFVEVKSPCADTGDTRAARRRRLRSGPAHEYPHRP
jgi:xanthine dehydrogenase YagR molybdenum-binding subunit